MGEWIESHAALREHPKLKRLARLLRVERPTAVGYLHYLWWWAMEYAPDGDLSRFDDEDVADATEWPGDPAELMGALRASGFMDGSELHDWKDYGEKLYRRRKANAERMRVARETVSNDTCSARAVHVRNTSVARGQDRTGQDKEHRGPLSAQNSLGDFAFNTLPTSQSTIEDYRRTCERHEARLPHSQIEQVVLELAEWKPPKPRTHLHLTLNRWLAKQQPKATAGGYESQFYFPEIPESEL